jgi:hypothetical protein
MDGVRSALKVLGKKAMPLDIQGYLKQKFEISMPTSVISTYKSAILKKKAKRKAFRAGGKGSPGTIQLHEIEAVKEVVEKLGAKKVQQLAKVLAR